MSSPKTVLMTVACTYSIDSDGNMIPCADSKASCEAAFRYANGLISDCQCMSDWCDFVIVTAACEPKGHRLTLGAAMAYYLLDILGAPDSAVECLRAPYFYTLGEMIALVRYLKKTPSVKRVVIFVKYWHALRCQEILLRLLEWQGLSVEVSVRPLESNPKPSDIHREFWVGTLKNMPPLGLCWLKSKAGYGL